MPLALEGYKVIEMGTVGPANMAAQCLGDLGADIITVEAPLNRARGAVPDDTRFKREADRNKRGIVLNLRTEEGRAILHQLAQKADVFIEANRPGIAQKLGFDYETLSAINPRLIVCSVTGFGQKGPYAQIPGHGPVWASTGGWFRTQGQGLGNDGGDYLGKPWTHPLVWGALLNPAEGNLPDIKTAGNVAIAVLAALLARERIGTGQHLDMAIVDSVVAVRSPRVPARGEEMFTHPAPHWNIYECRDGKYIALSAPEAIQWGNLCEGLGVPELAKERGATGQRAKEMVETFQRIFKTRTRDEWFKHLTQWDTEVARVNTIDEVRDDPHIKQRGMHIEVVGEDGSREVQYGSPIKLSKTPARSVFKRAPRLGEHTSQVLKELGYSEEEIARLREKEAVK